MSKIIGPMGNRILKIQSLSVPELRFEYHPDSKRIYYIAIGVAPEVGQLMLEGVPNGEVARAFVSCFCIGYKLGRVKLLGNQ